MGSGFGNAPGSPGLSFVSLRNQQKASISVCSSGPHQTYFWYLLKYDGDSPRKRPMYKKGVGSCVSQSPVTKVKHLVIGLRLHSVDGPFVTLIFKKLCSYNANLRSRLMAAKDDASWVLNLA